MYLLYLLTAHIATIFQGVNDGGVGSPAFTGVGSITGTVLTVTEATQGALAVGATLYDGPAGTIIPGTIIASFGSGGLGSIGTYNLNQTQTVASEPFIVPGVPNVSPPLGIVGRINTATEGRRECRRGMAGTAERESSLFCANEVWRPILGGMTAQVLRLGLFVAAPPGAYNPLAGYGPCSRAPGGFRG